MNEQKWNTLLKTLTAGVDEKVADHAFDSDNHVNFTFKFFEKTGLNTQGHKLLDVGSGTARLKSKLACEYVAIDCDDRAEVQVMDAHELLFPDKSFDLVYCNHVLEHVLAPIVVLSEIVRVLKDDGSVIIGVPVSPSFLSRDHNHVFDLHGWMHLFERAGLKVVDKKVNNEESAGLLAVWLQKKVKP